MILVDGIRHLLEWTAGLVGHIPMARVMLGSVLVLVLPGLSWSLVLFQGKQISLAERLVVSIGLSIAAGTLSIFAANRTLGLSITGTNSALVLVTIAAVPLVWLGLRRIWRKRGEVDGRDASQIEKNLSKARMPLLQMLKSDWAKLAPILGLAFFVAYIPHLNYPFPLHVDEWHHMAYSKAILQAQDLTIIDPYSGSQVVTPWMNPEIGYHLLLATFQTESGISWLAVFRYLPSVFFLLTVAGVYVIARREGFGWESALFASLIPTTVGILGPSFLVPVALGLAFVPLSLFVVFHLRGWRACSVLAVFNVFLFSMHAPSAIVVALILLPYVIINLKGEPWYALGMVAALLAPLIGVFLGISNDLMPTWRSLLAPAFPTRFVQLPLLIQSLGYVSIGVCLVGVVALAAKGGSRKLGLLLGLLAVMLMLFVFFVFHRGMAIVFERGILFAALMLAIIAGAGLSAFRQINLPWKLPFNSPGNGWGYLLCAVLVIAALATVIPGRLNQPYYHMIDEQDYQAFTWIEENVSAGYAMAVVDPWKGTAYTAISSRSVFTKIEVAPKDRDLLASQFLSKGSVDTAFLVGWGISIVYSTEPVSNPDLVQVRKNVYLLQQK